MFGGFASRDRRHADCLATAADLVVAKADGAGRRRRGDEVVVDAGLVDGCRRGLQALGGQSGVQAGEVLLGEELEPTLLAGRRDGERGGQLGRHFLC